MLSVFSFLSDLFAQCKEFAEDKVMPMLGDYVISGRYQMQTISEGQEILVNRSLSKGIKYRFVIKGDEALPQNVILNVETQEGVQIYSNVDNNYSSVWDFTCDKTQRVKIWLSVPMDSKSDTEPQKGCISFIVGIKASN